MARRTNPSVKRQTNPNSLANLKRGGSPGRKPEPPEIKKIFEIACPEAALYLVETMKDENVKTELRIRCAETIIERVLGKPQQAIDIESNNNHKIEVTLTEQLKTWAV